MIEYKALKIKTLVISYFQNDLNGGELHLYDRKIGQSIRQQMEEQLFNFSTDTVCLLDFNGITSIDFSCADEIIGKIFTRLLADEYGDIFIVLQNLNENHIENIQVALDRRKTSCLHQTTDNSWILLGHRKNYLLETLKIIMDQGEITTKELCQTLNLELTTASTRLSHLYKSHLVSRTQIIVNGGGREFLYRKLF